MQKTHTLPLIAIGALLISLLVWQYILDPAPAGAPGGTASNFEECAAAGGQVMESYPRQCRTPDNKHFTETVSKYSGQETRSIKSLSAEDIESLKKGTGDAFGGIAKLAELNGYPGPRHVLDLASELQLTADQQKSVEAMNTTRVAEAQKTGQEILQLEQDLDSMFAGRTMTDQALREGLAKSGELYGKLRYIHLKYHTAMLGILTADQVNLYSELRGYAAGGDPCANIPEGHDTAQWEKHNNCP